MDQQEIEEGTYNVAQVLKAEAEEILAQCEVRGAEPDLHFDAGPAQRIPDRFGLAFSGGGIRSACVGLGILQSLSKAEMLRQVHYISGVSGGGYILGWLTAWISRQDSHGEDGKPKSPEERKSLQQVEACLGSNSALGETEPIATPPAYQRHVEPFPLHYLRRYTSYLAPSTGLLSGDTLAMASIYLRNVLLNQTMLASLGIALLLLLQFPAFLNSVGQLSGVFVPNCWLWPLAILFVAVFSIGIFFTAQSIQRLSSTTKRESRSAALIAIACGVFSCFAVWCLLPRWYVQFDNEHAAIFGVVLLTLAGIVLTLLYNRSGTSTSVEQSGVRIGLMYALAWLVSGALGYLLHLAVHHWLILDGQLHIPHSYAVYGLPVLLVSISVNSYFWVGIMGTSFPDAKREWLARAAGYFLAIALVIALIFSIAFYGPVAMHLLFTGFKNAGWKKWLISAVIPGGWAFTVITGLIGGGSSKTDGEGSRSNILEKIVAIAPPLFLVGVLVLASWASHKVVMKVVAPGSPEIVRVSEYLPWAEWHPQPQGPLQLDWVRPGPQPKLGVRRQDQATAATLFDMLPRTANYLLLCLFFIVVAAVLACRLDVNEFSLHLFYRNRLVRAFLGASRWDQPTAVGHDPRNPSPFTGFASGDDIFLRELTAAKGFQGPYPIWGTCLNLTTGEDLAWQQRKGASFIYSPLFCGWDYVNRFEVPKEPETPECDLDEDRRNPAKDPLSGYGFRSTRPNDKSIGDSAHIPGYSGDGGAPLIGTAMAASGAAVSPNSGYHSKPSVAAFLTLFNLRLGWWTGNPRHPGTWKNYAPPIGYLMAELLGEATDRGQYVYLSDGGHFENLGIYELVRRRVRLIICSDADADPNFTFGDLGNAIDHCRRDFGVEIKIGAQHSISAGKVQGFRDLHYAIGEIVYPDHRTGILLYIKSSLTSDEPSDVLSMKANNKDFPHDTTLDQFFDESKFESYRALGQHMMDFLLEGKCADVIHEAKPNGPVAATRVRALFKWLDDQRTS